jgi:glycosyltransferase involved in cell wall biosynthesis
MNRKVCMFVWNHFTNDARVLRECTALVAEGYEVDLICIHDPKNKTMPYSEQRCEGFHIYRVRRYPLLLTLLQRFYHHVLQYKFLTGIASIFLLLALYYFPIVTILVFSTLKTKARVMVINASIILRMISLGFRKKYDIYHSNDLNTLPQGYICSKWRLRKKTLIYDSHEVQTSRTGYGTIHGLLEKILIKRIDSMLVENHTRAKFNEDLYGFYPHVVHNYPFKIDPLSQGKVNIHQLLHLQEDEKILLYQGGIQTGRGLDKLIQAVPLFTEGIVVLVGDGKIKPELQTMVTKMGLEDKVRFIPKVPLSDLPSYTRNAYLGFQVLNNVCFNHYSASSNKLFEYMMVGVPVIACNFPEIKRVVEGDQIGICIDSHSSEQIASAVNQLLCNESLHQTLSQNCLHASEKYNWELEKELFLSIYRNS